MVLFFGLVFFVASPPPGNFSADAFVSTVPINKLLAKFYSFLRLHNLQVYI